MSKWWVDKVTGSIAQSVTADSTYYRPVTLDDLREIVESCGGRIEGYQPAPVGVVVSAEVVEKSIESYVEPLIERIKKLEDHIKSKWSPAEGEIRIEPNQRVQFRTIQSEPVVPENTAADTPMRKVETVSCISPEIRGILMCPNCKSEVKREDYICPSCGQKLEDVE